MSSQRSVAVSVLAFAEVDWPGQSAIARTVASVWAVQFNSRQYSLVAHLTSDKVG
jgi:hypothetical protein